MNNLHSLRLAAGPRVAYPQEEERTLDDGSKAQRFLTSRGSMVVRRTCAPEERCRRRYWVWWEIEISE